MSPRGAPPTQKGSLPPSQICRRPRQTVTSAAHVNFPPILASRRAVQTSPDIAFHDLNFSLGHLTRRPHDAVRRQAVPPFAPSGARPANRSAKNFGPTGSSSGPRGAHLPCSPPPSLNWPDESMLPNRPVFAPPPATCFAPRPRLIGRFRSPTLRSALVRTRSRSPPSWTARVPPAACTPVRPCRRHVRRRAPPAAGAHAPRRRPTRARSAAVAAAAADVPVRARAARARRAVAASVAAARAAAGRCGATRARARAPRYGATIATSAAEGGVPARALPTRARRRRVRALRAGADAVGAGVTVVVVRGRRRGRRTDPAAVRVRRRAVVSGVGAARGRRARGLRAGSGSVRATAVGAPASPTAKSRSCSSPASSRPSAATGCRSTSAS